MQSTTRGLTSTFDYRWSTRQNTSASFGYTDERVTSTLPTNSRSLDESLTHSWDFRRTLSLRLEYQFSDQTMEVPLLPARPTDTHTGRFALEWRKRVSRTRTLSFGGGSGVMRVRTISSVDEGPLDYLAPSMSGHARLDLGRTWSVSANAHRDVTVLDGVTRQSFLSDTGSLWFGGSLGESWTLVFTGSFSRGDSHEGDVGVVRNHYARAQLQYALASCCTVVGAYSHYSHLLQDVSTLAPGFPSRGENKAVRVGMTFWLPLYGRFVGTRQFQTGRN